MTCLPIINCTEAKCHFKNTHGPTSRWATGSGTSGSGTRRTSWRLRRRRTCTLQKPPRLLPSVLADLQVLERLLLFFIFGYKAYMILFVVVFMSFLLVFVVAVFVFSIGFSGYFCCDLSAKISFVERNNFVQVQWCRPVHNGEAPPTAGRVLTAVFSAVYPVDCTKITPK